MSESRLEALVAGYAKMADRVHAALVESGASLRNSLTEALDSAQDEASKIDSLTHEEAGKLRSWLERDLYALAAWRDRTGMELQEWLPFEVRAEEAWLWDRLMGVADSTTVELLALKDSARAADEDVWLAGEVAGTGVLHCTGCGETLELTEAAVILPCPGCGNDAWQREPVAT